MSFDWAQLSLLGDGGSSDGPRGRRVRDSVTSPGANLEGDTSVRHGHPWALTSSCVQQAQLPECFPTNPASSEAWGCGIGISGLGSFSGTWH